MPCLFTNAAAGAADPNTWATKLNKLAHDDSHAVSSDDQAYTTFKRTVSSVVVISEEELRSLVQIEAKSAVEAAHRKGMRSISRNLV